MNEKHIDLDAMRALVDNPMTNLRNLEKPLRECIDEIEQLRKERDALRKALAQIVKSEVFRSGDLSATSPWNIARAALAAQGAKVNGE